MSSDRHDALDLIESMNATSEWMNKLDRLFSAVRTAAGDLPPSAEKDTTLAAVAAFRAEFYGGEDGDDDPNAVEVSGDADVTALSADAVFIVLGYPSHGKPASDSVINMAQDLAASYPEPRPQILLNPDNTFTISGLPVDVMEQYGWVRKA